MISNFIIKTFFFGMMAFGFYNTFASSQQMVMDAPSHAAGLDKLQIRAKDCVHKEDLSAKWLNSKFHIKDQKITEAILDSNKAWPEPCACPYNLDSGVKTKTRCGGRSHYSKTNSYGLICFPADFIARIQKH